MSNSLVQQAIRYAKGLPNPNSATVAVAQVDGQTIVGVNGNAGSDNIGALWSMTDSQGATLVVGQGDIPHLHAEGAVYDNVSEADRQDLKIGISNSNGPCNQGCNPYFLQEQQLTGVNVYWPERYWTR